MQAGKRGSRLVQERRAVDAGSADRELSLVIEMVLGRLPGSSVQMKFHHASFLVGGKVFGFTRPNGMVLKLPKGRVEELTQTRNASALVMGKRVMKEWVLLEYAELSECRGDLELLAEAMRFVAE